MKTALTLASSFWDLRESDKGSSQCMDERCYSNARRPLECVYRLWFPGKTKGQFGPVENNTPNGNVAILILLALSNVSVHI